MPWFNKANEILLQGYAIFKYSAEFHTPRAVVHEILCSAFAVDKNISKALHNAEYLLERMYLRRVACSRWLDTTLAPNGNRRRDYKPQVLAHRGGRVEQCHPGSPCNSPPRHLERFTLKYRSVIDGPTRRNCGNHRIPIFVLLICGENAYSFYYP